MKNSFRQNRLYDQQGLNNSKVFSKEKSQKQNRKIFRFVVLVFLGIVLLTLVAQIPAVVNKLRKPFHSIQSEFANSGDVNLRHRTNILLVTHTGAKISELGFISLAKGDRKIKLFKIDPETKVLTVNSIGSLSELTFENKKLSIDRLEQSIAGSFGYYFDAYIVIDDKVSWINKDSLEKLVDSFNSPTFLLKIKSNKDYLDQKMKTNLTLNEANDLIWFSKSLTPERISFTDLSGSKTADGFVDLGSVKNKVGLLLTDSDISNEEAAVEIENASKVSGVGSILKDAITNLGGNVLTVSKADETGKSRLIVKNKNSFLGKRLETILGVKMEQQSKNQDFEGDIKVIIGDDYAAYFDF